MMFGHLVLVEDKTPHGSSIDGNSLHFVFDLATLSVILRLCVWKAV
jgi:hypothetical protein